MELIESVALQRGIETQQIEDRIPYLNAYDVLLQFLMTLLLLEQRIMALIEMEKMKFMKQVPLLFFIKMKVVKIIGDKKQKLLPKEMENVLNKTFLETQ